MAARPVDRYTGTAPDGTTGELLLVNIDGTNVRRLGQLGYDNATRTDGVSDLGWAPDGRSVLASANGQLFRVDVVTGAATPIQIAGYPNPYVEVVSGLPTAPESSSRCTSAGTAWIPTWTCSRSARTARTSFG